MRAVLLSLAAAAALATPAMANEARVEARGGVVWDGGDSEALAGVAVGYDWSFGDSAFVGVEVSGDKVLESNTRVSFGVGARLGLNTSADGKLYGIAAYQTKPCRFCEESVSAGVGYQHNLGSSLYGKVEYRHFFLDQNRPDGNAVVAGLGVKF